MGSGATAELARDARQATVRPFEQGDAARYRLVRFQAQLGVYSHAARIRISAAKGGAISQNNPQKPKYRAMIALWKHIVRSLG
jgi:hypothetical protein